MCKKNGCSERAIGAHRALPKGFCRTHLIEAVRPQLRRYEVIGELGIRGLDDVLVQPGGTVELHPKVTNIPAMVSARLVREVKPEPAPKAAPAPKGDKA